MLESTLEVHRNGAYILLTENKNFKNTFPSNRAISDVVSFINTIIVEKLKEGKFRKNINDTINISEIEFVKLVREVKEKYSKGFSKEFRELQEDKLAEQTADYMKQYDMIRYNDEAKEYIIMPICFKIIGKYPKDFQI